MAREDCTRDPDLIYWHVHTEWMREIQPLLETGPSLREPPSGMGWIDVGKEVERWSFCRVDDAAAAGGNRNREAERRRGEGGLMLGAGIRAREGGREQRRLGVRPCCIMKRWGKKKAAGQAQGQ